MHKPTAKANPSEEAIKLGPIGIWFLLTRDDSNGSMSIFELFVPGGHKLPAPPYSNDAYEETLYGIEGVLTWTVDGTPVEVGPGQALCIPRGALHRFDNLRTGDAKQLVVISPAIWGPRTSARPPRSSARQRAGRPTARGWWTCPTAK